MFVFYKTACLCFMRIMIIMFSHLKCQNYLALYFFLDEVILALIIENDVNLLGAVATNIRACVK